MAGASGIGRYLGFVLDELSRRRGFDCVLVGDPVRLEKYKCPGWSILPYTESAYSPRQHFNYPLRTASVDLMYFPHIHIPFFANPGKKTIATIHDCYHVSSSAQLSAAEKIYMRMYYKRTLTISNKVAVVSEFTRSEIAKYFGGRFAAKCFINPNCIDSETWKAKTSPAVDSALDKPGKKVLFVGNVKPHKNLGRLVEAFERHELASENLIIVGKREGFINGLSVSQQKALESKRVSFAGWLSDEELASLYERVDLLVMPSLYEGFGLPPLEALRVRTPVAVADIPSLRETCGNNAAYFDPLNPESIARVIAEELEKPKDRNWGPTEEWLRRYGRAETAVSMADTILAEVGLTGMGQV